MATKGQDLFTEASADTFLNSHTPDVGAAWALETANNFKVIATTDDLRSEVGSGSIGRARKGDDIGADQMDITADVKVGAATTRRAGVCGRMTLADFTHQYEAYIQGTTGGTTVDVFLFKNVAGTRTQLGTSSQTLAAGTYATLKLSIRAGAQTVYFNGSSVISTSEADSTFTGQSYAGVIATGVGETTTRIDNFLSESVATSVGGPLLNAGRLLLGGALMKGILIGAWIRFLRKMKQGKEC